MFKRWFAVSFLCFGVLLVGPSEAQGQDGGLASEMPVLAPVVVAPFRPLRGVGDALRQHARFLQLPAHQRALISNDFYLFDEDRGHFVSAGPDSRIVLQTVQDGAVVQLRSEPSGRVLLPDELAVSGLAIEINAKGRYALRSRPSIRYEVDDPPTLAQLREAADQYFEAFKAVYAGRLFKAFVGSRKANCFAFLFFEPAVVNAVSVNGDRLYQSNQGASITIFRSDLNGLNEAAKVTASIQPARVGACLLERTGG